MTETERAEFIQFIDEKYDLLIRKIALEIVKDENLAYDVKQNVLLKLTPKVELLLALHPKQVTAYVGTTAKNEAITEYHRRKRYEHQQFLYVENCTQHLTVGRIELETLEERYGFGEDVWELLMELPQLDREIMICKYYYRMTSQQIAEEIGTNREMVKKRLQRIRGKLMKLIKERGETLR